MIVSRFFTFAFVVDCGSLEAVMSELVRLIARLMESLTRTAGRRVSNGAKGFFAADVVVVVIVDVSCSIADAALGNRSEDDTSTDADDDRMDPKKCLRLLIILVVVIVVVVVVVVVVVISWSSVVLYTSLNEANEVDCLQALSAPLQLVH